MKKDFKKNMDVLKEFTGTPDEPRTIRQGPTAQSLNIDFKKATRSERIQLLLTPELLKAVKKEAKRNKTSVNGFINAVLESYINERT